MVMESLKDDSAYPASGSFNSLGIPVNDLTLDETVDAILELAAHGRENQIAHLIATLNVDFLVNSLGGVFSAPRHPELLDVLRRASLVTADGFPIVMLSRIIGTPIRERVAGSDVVPALAKRAAKTNISLYLLGGREGIAQRAADKLTTDNPGLSIAGVDAPFVHTEGSKLANYTSDDLEVVRKINESGADVLLIGFGNPKQELWFHRNRNQLTVPVSIGIGGTFEFIIGTVKRAPVWMQRSNLEWVYRIAQDPRRLWKRYSKGMVKFGALLLPVVLMRIEELIRSKKKSTSDSTIQWNTLWSSRDDVIRAIRLPVFLRSDTLAQILEDVTEQGDFDGLFLIDFSQTKSIELAASQLFFKLGRLFQSGDCTGVLVGISKKMRRRMRFLQLMDVMHRNIDEQGNLLLQQDASDTGEQLKCKTYTFGTTSLIYLSGYLSGPALQNIGFSICVQDLTRDRQCVIDLRNVYHIESSAIGELQALHEDVSNGSSRVVFSGVQGSVKQMLRVLELLEILPAIDDEKLGSLIFATNQTADEG